MINPTDRIPRRSIKVMGHRHSVAMAGEGPPVVFIHGNATHSYAWRNAIPFLAHNYRCLAPDLAGMGGSDLVFPSGTSSYDFADQASGVESLIELLEPERPVVIVGHELGGTIAVQYARKNPESVAGIVLIEAVFRVSNDVGFPPDVRRFLQNVRSEQGEDMVLARNMLIEDYLPRLTSRVLAPDEMEAYRSPYARAGESRRAMLSMIRQLPLRSHPGPIDDLAEQSRLWCAQSRIPKLVVGGNPGFLVPPAILGTTARWANTTTASVRGLHFLMEDSPARLTSLILDWLAEIGHV